MCITHPSTFPQLVTVSMYFPSLMGGELRTSLPGIATKIITTINDRNTSKAPKKKQYIIYLYS